MVFGDFTGTPLLDNTQAPTPTSVPIDAGSQGIIAGETQRALQDPSIAQNQRMNQIDQGASEYGMLGTGGGITDAIKNKYGNQLAQDVSGIKFNASMQLRQDQMTKYKVAQQALLAQQQVQNDAFSRQMDAYNQREAARAAAIGSILGFGGMAAGAAIGGPMGAAAMAPKGGASVSRSPIASTDVGEVTQGSSGRVRLNPGMSNGYAGM